MTKEHQNNQYRDKNEKTYYEIIGKWIVFENSHMVSNPNEKQIQNSKIITVDKNLYKYCEYVHLLKLWKDGAKDGQDQANYFNRLFKSFDNEDDKQMATIIIYKEILSRMLDKREKEY